MSGSSKGRYNIPGMEKKKSKLKTYGFMLLIAALVFVLDQMTKYWIRTHLALRETITPIPALGEFFRIIHWKNTGIAFGLFQGNGWILTLIGIVIVLGIIIFSTQVADGPLFWRVAMGMELGGALGNLADRINPELGYVVDFIWIGNFPVFNLADSAIVIGAVILVIGMLVQEKKEGQSEIGEQEDAQ